MSDVKYYTVITDIGRAQIANALIMEDQIELTHMAIGDGNGSEVLPKGIETQLAHEVYRGPINYLNKVSGDPTQIVAKMTVLPDVGGFTVREVGLFDAGGNLIIYGSMAMIVKPVLSEGTAMDLTVEVRALVGNDVIPVLKIDPGKTIASVQDLIDRIKAHDKDPYAHSTTELPWINCGSCTRTGNTTITVSGDRRSLYPKGKRLRFNGSDTYLCRVFGDPTYAGGVTSITVWFDVASTVLPQSVTKLERSRLTPQDTADERKMIGTRDKATIKKLLESYCCGSYTKE